jgi:hypothetical protein
MAAPGFESEIRDPALSCRKPWARRHSAWTQIWLGSPSLASQW